MSARSFPIPALMDTVEYLGSNRAGIGVLRLKTMLFSSKFSTATALWPCFSLLPNSLRLNQGSECRVNHSRAQLEVLLDEIIGQSVKDLGRVADCPISPIKIIRRVAMSTLRMPLSCNSLLDVLLYPFTDRHTNIVPLSLIERYQLRTRSLSRRHS